MKRSRKSMQFERRAGKSRAPSLLSVTPSKASVLPQFPFTAVSDEGDCWRRPAVLCPRPVCQKRVRNDARHGGVCWPGDEHGSRKSTMKSENKGDVCAADGHTLLTFGGGGMQNPPTECSEYRGIWYYRVRAGTSHEAHMQYFIRPCTCRTARPS